VVGPAIDCVWDTEAGPVSAGPLTIERPGDGGRDWPSRLEGWARVGASEPGGGPDMGTAGAS
jgi:hypothetical protein